MAPKPELSNSELQKTSGSARWPGTKSPAIARNGVAGIHQSPIVPRGPVDENLPFIPRMMKGASPATISTSPRLKALGVLWRNENLKISHRNTSRVDESMIWWVKLAFEKSTALEGSSGSMA